MASVIPEQILAVYKLLEKAGFEAYFVGGSVRDLILKTYDKCILIGDFNLDYGKIYDDNYNNKNLFQDFEDILSSFNLIQLVKFETWSRMVGTERRSSILDHIYI